jgi:hypothetical protein
MIELRVVPENWNTMTVVRTLGYDSLKRWRTEDLGSEKLLRHQYYLKS